MRRRTARHHGKYLLTSYARSDSATGRVVSPKFTLEKRYLRFLLSGGKHPRRACVNLLVDGKTVRTATGENDDWFVAVAFDIAAFRGRDAIIEITDDQREVWGHINVDWIVQTDTLDAEAKQRVIATEPAPAPPKGRTVLTTRGPIRGTVSVAAGKIRVGEQTLEVGDLLQVTRDNKNRPPSATGGLKLSDGQVWFGRVLVEKDGKLGFEHPALGRLDVPLDQIACIEFQPGAPDKCEPGVLYRTKGEPIPGKVVWIRENDIAIDCALGVVPIPRGSLCRFVLAKVSGPPGPCDEVALLDGNLLRGELQIAGDRFALKERTTQKVVPLEWSAIHYIRRSPAGVSWLDTLDGKVLERVGPLLPPPAPEVVSSSALLCLRAIRMMPRTVVRYELPAPGKLRGELAPVPGCRGTVTVRIHQAGSPVWEKEVGPDTKPIALDVALKPGEVRIEVAFRGRIAFPCGIDWRDSHIVSGK